MRWWFVLRATEDILQNLEDQWERIKIQMSWKLEPVVYIQCHQGRWGRYLCSDSEFMVFQVMHLWQFNLYRWLFLTMALLPLYKQSLSRRRGKKHLSECSHSCGGRKLTQFQFTKWNRLTSVYKKHFSKSKIWWTTIRPDIVCIVATWLSGDILDSEVSLQGYQVFRLRHGGGVLM